MSNENNTIATNDSAITNATTFEGASELTADELLEMQEHVAEREMDEHLLGIVHPSAEQRRLHRHNECDGACARVAHRLSH